MMKNKNIKSWFIMQESFQSAYKTITLNKLRTFLSLLGITIGIFAIISVFTIVDSMEANVREDLASIGDDVINIEKWPWAPESGQEYEWWKYRSRPVPSWREYEEVKRKSNKARAVTFVAATEKKIKYLDNSAGGFQIMGVHDGFREIRNFDIETGRFFSDREISSTSNIAVIGKTVTDKLFKNISPVGKKIRVGGKDLIVIGTVQKEGNSGLPGGSLDKSVVVPIHFFQKVSNIKDERSNPSIWTRCAENSSVPELKEELRSIMRSLRRLKPKAEDNFALNQTSIFSEGVTSIFKVINIAGWMIGGFAILVGGFGIANIMFVSVRERTNIIGIQKALGAKRKYILYEVLYESALLSLLGGIIGLFLVFLGTFVVRNSSEFKIYLTFWNIFTGMVISICVGLFAGLAPAISAARLNPVEAISITF